MNLIERIALLAKPSNPDLRRVRRVEKEHLIYGEKNCGGEKVLNSQQSQKTDPPHPPHPPQSAQSAPTTAPSPASPTPPATVTLPAPPSPANAAQTAPARVLLVPLEAPFENGKRYRLAGAHEIKNRLPLFIQDDHGDTRRAHGCLILDRLPLPR